MINKQFLNTLTILYVEDNVKLQKDILEIFSPPIFKKKFISLKMVKKHYLYIKRFLEAVE